MTITFSRGVALGLAALFAASNATAKDRKPVDPSKMICHSDVPTGSRFPVRVCHTAAEWASIAAADSAAAGTMLDRTRNAGLASGAAGL